MPERKIPTLRFVIRWAPCLLLALAGSLYAQPPAGAPYVRNYPPGEYRAHNQNWAVAQDERGVMYFGNSLGALEYDGVSWRLIQTERKSIVRSLGPGTGGRVFIGGHGEIGYLAPNAAGQMQYVSLLPHVSEEYRNFTDVWRTLLHDERVYFVSNKYVFGWDGKKMQVWPAQTIFTFGFLVKGRVYIHQREIGLMQLVADSLQIAPKGEELANMAVFAMLPYEDRALIVTRENRLFLYDGISLSPFVTEADELFQKGRIYSAIVLKNGQYAIGMLEGGVAVVDAAGRIAHRINTTTGLEDDGVLSLGEDRQGALWIGLQTGIARAETGSPHSYFGKREGIEGSVFDILRHEGRLYFASLAGLYYLDENPGAPRGPGRFIKVSGVPSQCWALLPFGQSLLAGTFDGVYEIRAGQARRIADGFIFSLHRSLQDPNRVFAGLQGGVKSLYWGGGQWRDEGRIEGIEEEIRHIYETEGGRLWLVDYFSGLLRVDPAQPATLMRYDTSHGLPPADRVVAFPTDKGLRFATLGGIYRFDESNQRFFPDTALIQGLENDQIPLFSVSPDRQGNLWMVADDNAQSGLALRQAEGVYAWRQSPFLRIARHAIFVAYPDPAQENLTWIGGTDLVIRFDGALAHDAEAGFQTLIRQITAKGDSTLYAGAGPPPQTGLRLAYAFNSLRFAYAAPAFDDESKNEYQYFLEGYDKDWSNWTQETYKDYTGLPPGEYRFLVRAKNIYRQPGDAAVFKIEILPPFYRTWWAYLLYALLLAAGVWQLWRYALERIEKRRREEMKQLEFEKIKELDQLKSRFFANISHEFRTPLTLILGPVDKLLSDEPRQEVARQYHLIQNNAQRLLRLINQLLDLSKLDAGKMKLDLRLEDMLPILKGITYSFESMAESKNVQLSLESELESAWLYFDRDKMEQILSNLISNALKFTPEGGAVKVRVAPVEDGAWLQIEVADTGPGIAAGQVPHIFDRFFQGDEAARVESPGTGIGLALTKELVELHNGRIAVSSPEGEGACFRVLLPYGEAKGIPLLAEAAELDRENTLLLVEDNPDMRAFIRETLSGEYQIIEAPDGQAGVEMALERIPDIIVSDVMMPRLDGLELCGILKNDERTSHIPIILLTAKASVESRLAGLARGADDYLSKPFNREELLLRARNLLAWRQKLRARYAQAKDLEPAEDRNIVIEDVFLQKIRGIVEEKISDVDFEIDQLARVVGMSRSQLFRKIKALTGLSPSLFIRAIRLQKGKELLETTELNVSEVAYEVGFSTPAYFSDAFMEAYGVRPSQVRK
jgi:signal transduction histidine kinase/DNA-binding response OmpR family regulator